MLAGTTAFLGTTDTGLRVLIEPDSLTVRGNERTIVVRLGSPRAISGRIVETRQTERIDCVRRQWGLIAFEAFDENGSSIASQAAGTSAPRMVAVAPGSLGEIVLENACRLPVPLSL